MLEKRRENLTPPWVGWAVAPRAPPVLGSCYSDNKGLRQADHWSPHPSHSRIKQIQTALKRHRYLGSNDSAIQNLLQVAGDPSKERKGSLKITIIYKH